MKKYLAGVLAVSLAVGYIVISQKDKKVVIMKPIKNSFWIHKASRDKVRRIKQLKNGNKLDSSLSVEEKKLAEWLHDCVVLEGKDESLYNCVLNQDIYKKMKESKLIKEIKFIEIDPKYKVMNDLKHKIEGQNYGINGGK